MNYKCIKAYKGIPVGAVVDVETFGGSMTIYVTYKKDGRSRIIDYKKLKEHFKEEKK